MTAKTCCSSTGIFFHHIRYSIRYFLREMFFITIYLLSFTSILTAQGKVVNLTCEYVSTPISIDARQPRFCWQIQDNHLGAKQTAYQLQVASAEAYLKLGKPDIWDSEKIMSGKNTHIKYSGPALVKLKKYFWQVTIWGNNDMPSKSSISWFETGWMDSLPYQRSVLPILNNDHEKSVQIFRKVFLVTNKLKSAKIYLSGPAPFLIHLNGIALWNAALDQRMAVGLNSDFYFTYDIASCLRVGKNIITITAEIDSNEANPQASHVWSFMRLKYFDDSLQTIETDSTWYTMKAKAVATKNIIQEYYIINDGWDEPEYVDSTWISTTQKDTALMMQYFYPYQKRQFKYAIPLKIFKINPNVVLNDFGKVITAAIKIKVKGPNGGRLGIKFSDRLKEDSSALLMEKKIDKESPHYRTYDIMCKGDGYEIMDIGNIISHFRYVELSADSGVFVHPEFTALNIFNPIAGNFSCSDSSLNNRWRQEKKLFYETNDIWKFEPEQAIFLTDVVAAGSHNIPNAGIRETEELNFKIQTDKSSNFFLTPWIVYCYYGDVKILSTHYLQMKQYVNKSNEQISISPHPDTHAIAKLYRESMILSRAASLLGKLKDAKKYITIANELKLKQEKNISEKLSVNAASICAPDSLLYWFTPPHTDSILNQSNARMSASEWFFKRLGGIIYDTASGGFSHFFIKPYFPDTLKFVKTTYASLQGKIESSWAKTGKQVNIFLKVPANTSASLILPSNMTVTIKEKKTRKIFLTNKTTFSEEEHLDVYELPAGSFTASLE